MVVVWLGAADALQTLGPLALVRGAGQALTLCHRARFVPVRVSERKTGEARENSERQSKRQQNGTSLHLRPPVLMPLGRTPRNSIQCTVELTVRMASHDSDQRA